MARARLLAGAAGVVLAMQGFSVSTTAEVAGRYSMSPAEGGGFIRLDTQTGQMSLCQRRESDWSCREIAEPERGLASEIERLREENNRLKAELRQLEDIVLGDKRAERDRGREGGKPELRLPSEQDIDNVMSYAQRMLRKFREKLKELEAESKGTPL
jgi:hypothetical protein